MTSKPSIILSAFADESANSKTAAEQFAALAAIGLQYYSPRFVDVGGGGKVKHVTELDGDELTRLAKMQTDYGLKVTSIGARLGKVKLLDIDDGSHNKFVPDAVYHAGDVAATIRAAQALGAVVSKGRGVELKDSTASRPVSTRGFQESMPIPFPVLLLIIIVGIVILSKIVGAMNRSSGNLPAGYH